MKKAILAVFCLFVTAALAHPAGDKFIVNITVGKVQVSVNKGKTWKNASPDMELKETDMVRTGKDAYCDLVMPNRSVFRVGDGSVILLRSLSGSETRIRIQKGKGLFRVTRRTGGTDAFLVETEVGVAAVRGTEFMMDTDNDKLDLSVADGTVSLKRNVRIPDGVELDEEMAGYLEVQATANQALQITMAENRELEKAIARAKNNKDELLNTLKGSYEYTYKKLRIMKKNVNRVFGELHEYRDDNDSSGPEEEDDTSDVINKAKRKMPK